MIPCCSSVSAKPAVGRAGSAPLIRRDFGLRPLPNADSLGDVATFFGALLSRKRSPYDSAWQAGEQWAAVVENFRTRPRHVDLSSRYIRIPAVHSRCNPCCSSLLVPYIGGCDLFDLVLESLEERGTRPEVVRRFVALDEPWSAGL